MVGLAGLEPAASCSPSTRASRAAPQPGVVGSPGVEPGLPPSRTGWISVFLEPGGPGGAGGEGRNRTGSSTLAGRDRCHSCHPREWTAPDLNRDLRHTVAALCQLELAAHGRRDGARRPAAATQRTAFMRLTLWSCQCASTFTRRWCAQGRTESNCHSAGFGDQPPNRWVIPMQRPKNAQPK